MLQQIRDRTSGIVAGFIVALLVVPFAFFGIETFAGGGGDPVVAKVGKQNIHQSQFQNTYDQRYGQYISLMGENFKPEEFKADDFRKLVLDDMTQEAMLRQFADQAQRLGQEAGLGDQVEVGAGHGRVRVRQGPGSAGRGPGRRLPARVGYGIRRGRPGPAATGSAGRPGGRWPCHACLHRWRRLRCPGGPSAGLR